MQTSDNYLISHRYLHTSSHLTHSTHNDTKIKQTSHK